MNNDRIMVSTEEGEAFDLRNATIIQICIVSPGDIPEWRNETERFIKEYTPPKDVIIDVVRWEKDTPNTSNIKDIQGHININLIDESDILVGMFWSKFGTATKNAKSGTEEEIKRHLEKEKPVILYLIDEPIKPSVVNSGEYKKIEDFKMENKDKGVYTLINDFTELRQHLEKDITYNINKVISNSLADSDKKKFSLSHSNVGIEIVSFPIKLANDGEHWFENSITSYINKHISEHGYNASFERHRIFQENYKLHKSIKLPKTLADDARKYAFNEKYGNYNYEEDMRHHYPKWATEVRNKLKDIVDIKGKSVIGVGSNYGLELTEIFREEDNVALSVLDISDVAIKRGKTSFPKIKFYQGDMGATFPANKKYDIYLNLRAIHSSGVGRNDTIIESLEILNNGGVALFSVSNGYSIENEDTVKVIYGLYDHNSRTFTADRPYEVAKKLRKKLEDFKYEKTGIMTISTEILVWGIKP